MIEPLESRFLLAAFAVQVAFAPVKVAAYPDYLMDHGARYAGRGNGYTYGWSAPNRAATVSRSATPAPAPVLDTGITLRRGQRWEVAVPDGTYSVRVTAGDARATAGTVRLAAEGTIVVDARLSGRKRWATGEATVAVSDGRLTLTAPRGGSRDRLCLLEVRQVGSAPPVPDVFDPPITITQGGTYRGNWRSLDPATPAVRVETSEPVVIEDSAVESRGTLIEVGGGADLTVRNTAGVGLDPGDSRHHVGRFIDVDGFTRIDVRNCSLDRTAGIYLHNYVGDHTPAQSVAVVANRATDVDGRYGEGAGGYSSTHVAAVQFLQLDGVANLPGVEIAWNQVTNAPGRSAVEDNISIYASSGTPASPIRIHDNFIDGAYPADPASRDYSGGGIMLSDHGSAYVAATDNQVLDTTNYGIAIASGHDNVFSDNRIVSSGRLPDGRRVPAQNVGAYIWNQHHERSFARNAGADNLVYWAKGAGRNDWWVPDAQQWSGNRHAPAGSDPGPVEQAYWQSKLTRAGVRVGPSSP